MIKILASFGVFWTILATYAFTGWEWVSYTIQIIYCILFGFASLGVLLLLFGGPKYSKEYIKTMRKNGVGVIYISRVLCIISLGVLAYLGVEYLLYWYAAMFVGSFIIDQREGLI